MSSEETEGIQEGVAIVGMTCRFPGAASIDKFWQNLRDGVESVTFFSDDQLVAAGVDSTVRADENFVPANAALADIELFDAPFFGFTPREAQITDPQHRLFLECAWEALESAGYDSLRIKGSVGVFAGAGMSTYFIRNLVANNEIARLVTDFQFLMGNSKDFVSTRVSYKLNLTGPSVNVGTACSTSLVAVHLACQSLLDYQCDMALAGGVGITVPQESGYLYEENGINSPDGHCRAFDVSACGTVNGNGAGIVVLKRLDDAARDGDIIHAVIRGSAINNDGSQKVGYTAPSITGQAEVITEALAVADVEPATVTYVEAHGTGTVLGDPIEIEALTQAFRSSADRKGHCAVGSVKTNFGHLDEAAGVAGLIKTVLALKHRQIPPSLHFEEANPKIDFENSPFYVNAQLADWPTDGVPRRAGVSSFGIGGTNAHVVLEEYEEKKPAGAVTGMGQLFVLSAKTETALATMSGNLAEHFESNADIDAADAAYTLGVGRRAFEHRRAVLGTGVDVAAANLRSGGVIDGVAAAGVRGVVFMFSGQGSQYENMGRGLYASEPVYREEVDRCSVILEDELGYDLRKVLYPDDGEQVAADLGHTSVTQPALFTVEYALARLWMSWGIEPDAMIGHSIGEYVAACIAGVFTVEDALRLVSARGKMMGEQAGGSMLAVMLAELELEPLLGEDLCIGVINGPELCVVSGGSGAVSKLAEELGERGIGSRAIRTSHAFHSRMMEPVVADFAARVGAVNLKRPELRYVSNVTGSWIKAEEAMDPAYWARHLRGTVRFSDGLDVLLGDGEKVFVEVGPGNTLSTLAKRHPVRSPNHVVVSSMRHPKAEGDDRELLLRSVGELWVSGVDVDWNALHSGAARRRLCLPTYPFERQRYWIDASDGQVAKAVGSGTEQVDSGSVDDWLYVPSWCESDSSVKEQVFSDDRSWLVFVDEHGVGDRLMARLAERGQAAVAVRRGVSFEKRNDVEFVLNPGEKGDYGRLLSALADTGRTPGNIAHLWNISRDDGRGVGSENEYNTEFYSMLFLVQALGEQVLQEETMLYAVSSNMQCVTGEEDTCPAKALLLGLVAVVPHEYPHFHCRSIDLLLEDGKEPDQAELLIAEFQADRADRVVAYRGGRRFVRRLESAKPQAMKQDVLRDGGVYLVTGGLGGMGLELGLHLAESARAKLVLIELSDFPVRDEWADWQSSHGRDDKTCHRIRKIRQIERAGGEVMVLQADITDVMQMRGAVDAAVARFGPINGLIHAAGVPDGSAILRCTRDTVARILAPKVRGTKVLAAVLESTDLDFIVVCSALTSVVGSFGQVAYCGANAFLDAFAQSESARTGATVVSINWDAWREVGMAVDAERGRPAEHEDAGQTEQLEHHLFSHSIVAPGGSKAYVSRLGPGKQWLLDEHRVGGMAVLPGTAYLELAAGALALHAGAGPCEIREVYFLSPMAIPDDEELIVHTVLTETGVGEFDFSVLSYSSHNGGAQQEHARGVIVKLPGSVSKRHDIEQLSAGLTESEYEFVASGSGPSVSGCGDVDGRLAMFGPRWWNLKNARCGDGGCLCLLELAGRFTDEDACYVLHPALMDMATGFLAIRDRYEEGFPFSYGSVKVAGRLPGKIYSHIRYSDESRPDEGVLVFDVTIMDESGVVLVDIDGYTLRGAARGVEQRVTLAETENRCLSMAEPGDLDGLVFTSVARTEPSAGEVEIEVKAVGLNFKEVLLALGMIPWPEGGGIRFGLECSGVISAVGKQAEGFKVGDNVIAFAPACFGRYVTTSSLSVAPLPAHLDFAEGATIPAAFMTAYHALVNLARLKEGERVLIHAAAGGVGMAAVTIARQLGAEIFGTAGNPEKREFLSSLGVSHVMNSRSLDFADEIMDYTGGEGVDVVLNSLSGEFITRSLSILAPYGRFLEIGIRDIQENMLLGLRPFEKCLSYFAVGVGPGMPGFDTTWQELIGHFESRDLEPLHHKVFRAAEVADAFDYMARALHIGKVVVAMDGPLEIRRSAPSRSRGQVSPVTQGLLSAEGVAVFSRALSAGLPQLIVCTRGREFLDGSVTGTTDTAGTIHERPGLKTEYVAPEGGDEEAIAGIWQELLGIARIGRNDNFFELGGDSLIAAQAVSRLYKACGVRVPLSALFDDPTVAGTARRVEEVRCAAVERAGKTDTALGADEEEGAI